MIREGRIFADGSKQELLTKAKLRELFGVEVEMAERNGFFHAW
jgi:iron complex transport system ATP-binding protein